MTRFRIATLTTLAFAAGLVCAHVMPSLLAQGRVTELKRVDLGSWCAGKEAVISLEEIAPQHQSKHSHPAYSFAWMIEGSQRRFVDGKPAETFQKGDVTGVDVNCVNAKYVFHFLDRGTAMTTINNVIYTLKRR